ncbi:MAG TPA: hypothetical protein VFN10_15560 [Thermoanaerobaculia bacterium]|nr:hypothetical protein [Thermoanaerobaculia bacterium]
MRSPAAAIAWEFRRRHRWGFLAFGVYLVVLAVIKFAVLGGRQFAFRDEQAFAFAVVVPTTITFLYVLAVFTFGLDGDLAARESIYPARLFTLPLSSDALAGLPMLYGCSAAAVLWLATRFLGIWPAGVNVPVIWPALLAASLVAWTQALTWMPYPLRGLRVIVTILWLSSLDAIVLAALHFQASEPLMLTILAPHVPLAYLVARSALRRARCGDVADWQRLFTRGDVSASVKKRAPFASASRAQVWFEWRRHGQSLPLLVAVLLPFELAMLFLFHETAGIVVETFVIILLTPAVLATFVAATVSKSTASASDAYTLGAFTAARPLSDVALIGAKLKATILSALVAWLLVIVATIATLKVSGAAPVILDGAHWLANAIGPLRAALAIVLALIALIASTWKQLVQSLAIGMSGRAWMAKRSLFATLALLAIVLPSSRWITRSKALMAALWTALPWILGALVCIKTLVASWIALRLFAKRVLSDRTLVIAAACWSATVIVLSAALAAIFPAVIVRHYVLIFIAILAVPLVRLAAAPLALDWNRHR